MGVEKNNKNEGQKKGNQEEGEKGKETKTNDISQITMNHQVSVAENVKKEDEKNDNASIKTKNLSSKNDNNSAKSKKPLWRRVLEIVILIFNSLLAFISFINLLLFIISRKKIS